MPVSAMFYKYPFVVLDSQKRSIIMMLLPLLFSIAPVHSQVTITSDLVTSGDTVMYRGIDFYPDSSIVPGGAGLSVWDFSSLVNDDLDTLNFVDPLTTPYFLKFPTSTMCVANKYGYTYFRKTAASLGLVGSALDFIGNGTLLAVKALPDLTYIPFPSTYLTSFNNSSIINEMLRAEDLNANNFDSIAIVGTVQTFATFDAYGTMITPFDSMEVIRQKVTEVLNYTVTGKKYLAGQVLYSNLLISESSTETRYLWWTDSGGVKFPVVEMDVTLAGVVRSVQFAISLNVRISGDFVTACHDSCNAEVFVLGGDSSYSYIWFDPDTQTTDTARGLCQGSYQVEVTDTTGAYVRIAFKVANATEITALVEGFTASCETCNDGVAVVSPSGGTAPYSFLWDSSAAFQITAVAHDLVLGPYSVTVVDDNGCPKQFSAQVKLFDGVKIYPNPADDVLIIFTRLDGQMEFQVFDLSGRMVRSYAYYASESTLDVSTLPEGHYIYRLIDETGVELKFGHFEVIRP
ncbi:MAG: T9SS type A sorting domain-containing protein [Flavobacteriales bacterium]|nr:T9SS type A sorting domain-containing protein [Flavobacteriales bacterium]